MPGQPCDLLDAGRGVRRSRGVERNNRAAAIEEGVGGGAGVAQVAADHCPVAQQYHLRVKKIIGACRRNEQRGKPYARPVRDSGDASG